MKNQKEMQYEPPKVTNKEAMQVMIKKKKKKFFEPLDLKQWNNLSDNAISIGQSLKVK